MNSQQKLQFKKDLYRQAVSLIEKRINTTTLAMQQAQEAANEEGKSSAGDKYETSRAMNHLEKDMYARQLEENKKELALLQAIDCDRIYETVVPGSLISCRECFFFIAAGLGRIDEAGATIYLLSPHAPIAKQLYHKKEGDIILFNKKEMKINWLC